MSLTSTKTHSARRISLKTPPGPKNPLSSTLAFQRTPLAFLSSLRQQYGDIAQFRLLTMPVVVISHPDYVQQVLQKKYTNYDKDVFLFNVSRSFLGNGLVTAVGGESWLRQRRLMQPAFHRQRITAMGQVMTDTTLKMLEHWQVCTNQDQTLDIEEEMMRLTLQIAGLVLFTMDVSGTSHAFGQAYAQVNTALTDFLRFPLIPLSWPTSRGIRYRRAIRAMDKIAYDIIHRRRQSNEDANDLLSMLLQARDEETGEGMSDLQLRDEVMTLLFAGHETSAKALTWTWYLLAKHPHVERKLHEELGSVLEGRTPTIADLPRLPYARMILEESMRLYPPSWQVMRQAREEDEMGGYRIPAHTIIFWSQYIVHRHPDFWENPEQFDPERFSPEQGQKRHSCAYIPFSSGPRMCIGNALALTEMHLILATIAQRYRLALVPDNTSVEPIPLITLHPGRFRMRLEPAK
ncbi:MAG: cytochrome P450 [Ktedonobacteraceae bacterium]|nr:cytochrome P450 [Ktedonobacteraceae bacterium]